MNPFQKATRSQVFLKLAITGPTGSGKTFSALRLAVGLLDGSGKRIAFIDTENRSASLYAPPDGEEADGIKTFDFDTVELEPPFEHEKFANAIKAAVDGKYGLVVIDSSSHFWEGILEYKSKLDARQGSNSYTNWNEAGKKFQTILDAVLQSNIHVICCMRSKMDYILEQQGNKTVPKRVGLAPIMRDGITYEFTTVFDVALNHEAQASKDRSQLFGDKMFVITEDTGRDIRDWLKTATPKQETQATPAPTPEPTHLGKIKKLRAHFDKERGDRSLADYEIDFCKVAAEANNLKREYTKLDEFEPEIIDAIWPKAREYCKGIADFYASATKP